MKLPISALAGVALIALAGCNRNAATNNAAGNAAANASETAAPAANSAAPKPSDGGDEAVPADNGADAGGAKPADGAAVDTDPEAPPPAEGESGK